MREQWSSRAGFVLTTAGFAVGLGNVWRFPYLVGENGGGAFLLVYVAFAVLIGLPLLTAEISLGRASRRTPIAGMERLTGTATSPWNLIGWLGVVAAVLITAYYVMLIAWLAAYTARLAVGSGFGESPEETQQAYAAFVATPGPILVWAALVVVFMAWVTRRGLTRGVERVAKVAMPFLLLLLVVLAVRSLTFPGAVPGLVWYVKPDFAAIDAAALRAALGQAFFSIGIGMAVAFGLGSYLPRDTDVPGDAALVVVLDTGVAFIAGLVLFPALFAFGMSPDQGPGLLFVTMTALFAQMPWGGLFGVMFFFLLLIAGLTSQLAMFEVLVASLVDSLDLSRARAVLIAGVVAFVSCVPVILSQGPWSHVELAGMDLFDLANRFSGDVLLPLGGFVLSLYVAFGRGWQRFRRETNVGAGRIRVGPGWVLWVRFVIPGAVALVLLGSIGLF